ncbi:hypothetical protein MPTK1_1g05050 [Marchantia polymorpha subsp. ruderalis]|uniref:Uncharacterized protein n=2 Tax=Marchantia polymorpha TaxID=3197 RepID=A0AAF6ALM9_MARPO|nr:hypothetical protein MARPO_0005s0104 [Marchantia polymorpha]BBM97349.1 hypothetical protein Mp_1g05050 [Marchantia polymorpha subsp. ruderalis]|eukprot:PTQ48460.1 hypothetical protein MARPO_0005s0104 [Marchantia polymorpha]
MSPCRLGPRTSPPATATSAAFENPIPSLTQTDEETEVHRSADSFVETGNLGPHVLCMEVTPRFPLYKFLVLQFGTLIAVDGMERFGSSFGVRGV